MISDHELRVNHDFVLAFESLRKTHGYREMSDAALRDIAESTGLDFETLRVARHLRNALAHGEPVNRDSLQRMLDVIVEPQSGPTDTDTLPAAAPALAPHAYRVHGWRDPDLERQMLANGFVSVGGAEIGDLTGVTDPEAIRSVLTRSMPDRNQRAIALFVGYWRRFLWQAAAGDLVVLPTRDRLAAIGEFVGPYHYVADAKPRARHRRMVAWIGPPVPRDAFGDDLLVTLNGRNTVQEFKAENAVSRLHSLAASGIDPG